MDDTIIPVRPSFLDRFPGDTKPERRRRAKIWRLSALARKIAVRAAKKRDRIVVRPLVYQAVEAGAETLQAIRKHTGLDSPTIHAALRFYINQNRAIRKDGRRYFVVR